MARYYDVIGDGASGFVLEPEPGQVSRLDMDGVWLVSECTRCRANGQRVDMTDEPVGKRVTVDGWVIVRTETGLKARDRFRRGTVRPGTSERKHT